MSDIMAEYARKQAAKYANTPLTDERGIPESGSAKIPMSKLMTMLSTNSNVRQAKPVTKPLADLKPAEPVQ